MDINLSLSPAAIPVNWLVVAIYKSTSPGVVEDFQAFPAPHLAPQNVVFTGLDPQTYIVTTYESLDGTPTGTIRHTFFYDPSFQVAEIRPDLFLQVGVTPGMDSGATAYDDATLDGWEYSIELRQSYGTLQPDVDWQYTLTGWELLIPDYTFQIDEVYILHFYPKISTFEPIVTTANLFSDLLTVTADTVLAPADTGKMVLMQSATAKILMTLPLIAEVEVLKPICFMSNGGSHINGTISTQGGNVIQFLNNTPTSVFIGQGEQIWLMRGGDNWIAFNLFGNFSSVGLIETDYSTTRLNTIFAAGQLLTRANYPRLWQYVQSLDVSMLVTDADWSNPFLNNKSRYSTGDGVTTFRVPLLYEQGFLRGVDGTVRKASSKEVSDVISHDHYLFRNSAIPFAGDYASSQDNAGGGVLAYKISESVIAPNKFKSSSYGGAETRPKNTGVYFLINI